MRRDLNKQVIICKAADVGREDAVGRKRRWPNDEDALADLASYLRDNGVQQSLHGWSARSKERQRGVLAGHIDRAYFDPQGNKYDSKIKVRRRLQRMLDGSCGDDEEVEVEVEMEDGDDDDDNYNDDDDDNDNDDDEGDLTRSYNSTGYRGVTRNGDKFMA
eukprot:4236599-Prymnesium_polylepis.1